MIAGGQYTLMGSTNWTYHALTNNHEVSVLIRSKDVAKEMIDYFNRVRSSGSHHKLKNSNRIPRNHPLKTHLLYSIIYTFGFGTDYAD